MFSSSINYKSFKKIQKTNRFYYFELIGPAGIGKSTILKCLRNNLDSQWLYHENIPEIDINESMRLTGGSIHWNLLSLKANNLKIMDINGYRKSVLLNYFSNIINADYKIVNNFCKKRYILDEGLCHNFARELVALPRADFRDIMAKRVLFLIVPKNCDTVVQRIRKRQTEGGHTVIHHIGLSDRQLIEITEKSIFNHERLIDRCVTIDMPFRKLFAEDELVHNCDAILKYIDKII